LKVNGDNISDTQILRGYARLQRTWKQGDVIEVSMPMPVEKIKAHPLVEADAGKLALMRGPLVYCVESADNNQAVHQIGVPSPAEFTATYRPDLLEGIMAITGTGRLLSAPVWNNSLYAAAQDLPQSTAVKLIAIPYYANANRGPVDMAVWLPAIA
jgi:uncharacterized protein